MPTFIPKRDVYLSWLIVQYERCFFHGTLLFNLLTQATSTPNQALERNR
jgi:hypothetical protein